jgi:diguanylate cyclase (GGDEF)-like protein
MSNLPDSLIRAPLFQDVPLAAIETFVAAGSRRELAPGDVLLRAGEANEQLHIILSGSLTVRIAGAERAEVHLAPGQCVGELSVIDQSGASSEVIAREPTVVLAVHRTEVWALIQTSAEVARNLLGILAGRVRHDDLMLTETSRLQARFEHEATVDALTGVRNRRWLDLAFEQAIAGLRDRGGDASVLMIDLDHFKTLNDTHGHSVGDAVLRRTSQVLAASLRPTDLVARYGGEEFAALLPDTDLTEAVAIAERLRNAVRAASSVPALPPLSISVGVASAKPPTTADALLSAADAALYRAKHAGRNCVRT